MLIKVSNINFKFKEMAIDSIEYNELGALSQSRIGSKCFVTDNSYSNFSIVSKREKERRRQLSEANVSSEWSIDSSLENNCEYLQDRLTQLQNAIEGELQKNPSKVTNERLINPMRSWEVKYKNLIQRNKCVQNQEALQSEEQKKQALAILQGTSETTPTQTSKTTKYIIYGVGGLIVVIGLVLLLKRKS